MGHCGYICGCGINDYDGHTVWWGFERSKIEEAIKENSEILLDDVESTYDAWLCDVCRTPILWNDKNNIGKTYQRFPFTDVISESDVKNMDEVFFVNLEGWDFYGEDFKAKDYILKPKNNIRYYASKDKRLLFVDWDGDVLFYFKGKDDVDKTKLVEKLNTSFNLRFNGKSMLTFDEMYFRYKDTKGICGLYNYITNEVIVNLPDNYKTGDMIFIEENAAKKHYENRKVVNTAIKVRNILWLDGTKGFVVL